MYVEVQLEKTSESIKYTNVLNAYTKGPMYCVFFEKGGKRVTHKFPIAHIFRVVEDYADSKREPTSQRELAPGPC